VKRRVFAVLAAVGVALAACGGDGPSESGGGSPGEVDPDGVVRIGYDLVGASRGGFTLVPAESGANASDLGVYHWVYGSLMRPVPGGGFEPDLAESATVVDDRTVEVVLREGLTFSDGTPLDAETVQASLERNIANRETRAFRAEFYDLESVEVTGASTLTLHIPNGTAASWYDEYIGGEETVIVPEDVDPQAPVGAGPFVVSEFVPEQRIVFEKNPEYWDAESIRVGGVELLNTPDPQNAVSALRADQVDFARLDHDVIDAAESAGVEVVFRSDANRLTQLPICKTEEPFSDARVRRALSLAIDREAINEAVFDGEGEPTVGLWPEGHPFHSAALAEETMYDPDAARELLDEAGYGDGFTFEVTSTGSGGMAQILQIVQQQWEEVGVTARINNSSNYVEDFNIQHITPMGGIPVAGDNNARLDQWTGEGIGNVCEYSDPELDGLAGELRTVGQTRGSDQAVDLWAGIQDVVARDALSVILLFQPAMHAYDAEQLGDVEVAPYVISVPDMWQITVGAS
jgi:peptide/nickel transport system substrate-binding protein